MGRQLELAVLHMQLLAYRLPSASAAQHTTAEPASAAAASCRMLAPAPAQQCTMSKAQTAHVFHMLCFGDHRQETKWLPDIRLMRESVYSAAAVQDVKSKLV